MSRPRVLLVGWDSADWQVITPLMDRGELPLLRKLVESLPIVCAPALSGFAAWRRQTGQPATRRHAVT